MVASTLGNVKSKLYFGDIPLHIYRHIQKKEEIILQQKLPTRYVLLCSKFSSININTTTLLPAASLYKSNGTSRVHYNSLWHVCEHHTKPQRKTGDKQKNSLGVMI